MAKGDPKPSQTETRVYLERIVAQTLDAEVKDLNKIRFAFEAKKSARFEDFSSVFRDLKASMMFQGYASEINARIFIEDIYELLLLEFEDTEVVLSKVFIVYMLYASYYCQTCRPRVPIRLRDEDFQRLEAFITICRQDNHSDIIYAVRRLQADGAFHYVHTLRSYGFKSYVLDPLQSTHRKLRLGNKIASHRHLLTSTDLFRRLSFVHEKYCELKSALNLTPAEESIGRKNPFEIMQSCVSHAGSSLQNEDNRENEDSPESGEEFSDEDAEGIQDVDFDSMMGSPI